MVKEIDFSKKGKKVPKYKQLGLTPVKNAKGNLLGYNDKEGNYIPRRQYDKIIGKPGKGSPGHAERTDIKRRKVDVNAYAKKKGATREGATYGAEREVPRDVTRNFDKHNKAVLSQRMQSINFKHEQGLLTRKQWQALRNHAWEENELSKKLADVWEKLENNAATPGGKQYTNAQRRKLEEDYRKLRAKYDKHHNALEKKGIVPPRGSDLEHGYYHP